MDGGGRLARSLRPLADLKAAAIGAAVLLRERLGSKRTAVKPLNANNHTACSRFSSVTFRAAPASLRRY